MSVGSLNELSYILRLALDLGLGSKDEIHELETLRQSAGKLTWRLYDAMRKKSLQRHPSRATGS